MPGPSAPAARARRRGRAGAVLIAMSLVVSACGSGSTPADAPASLVATTAIWTDILTNVACDEPEQVRSLMPPGVDPHGFEPSLADRGLLEDAALVVANGAGLEGRVDATIEAVDEAGVSVVRVSELMGVVDGDDPHLWFDPIEVRAVLPQLADAVVTEGHLDQAGVDACVAAYTADLTSTDERIGELLDAVPADRRLLVTNHDAFGRFAARYGLEVVGTVLPSTSTLAEASPTALAELARTVEAMGVPAIFVEVGSAGSDARRVADSAGVELVELYTDSLGPEAPTYLDLLRVDAERIAAALG